MTMDSRIDKTKKWFNDFFSDRDEYNSQTQDEKHLNAIIHALKICDSDCKILDIGTGTGYLAFEIAKRYKNANVTGLDIVEKTLRINQDKAIEQEIQNLNFISYDGLKIPFGDGSFDVIVTRYALHHFPDIKNSFSEIARVLKKSGKLLIADPIPAENDSVRFIDEYMKLKPDGHVRFYTKSELVKYANEFGLIFDNLFQTKITFPRTYDYGESYVKLLNSYDKNIVNQYNLHQSDDAKYIYITINVLNSIFIKK